jgi:hypothetical protein
VVTSGQPHRSRDSCNPSQSPRLHSSWKSLSGNIELTIFYTEDWNKNRVQRVRLSTAWAWLSIPVSELLCTVYLHSSWPPLKQTWYLCFNLLTPSPSISKITHVQLAWNFRTLVKQKQKKCHHLLLENTSKHAIGRTPCEYLGFTIRPSDACIGRRLEMFWLLQNKKEQTIAVGFKLLLMKLPSSSADRLAWSVTYGFFFISQGNSPATFGGRRSTP